jgi:DNA-binding response OmpR family regulator
MQRLLIIDDDASITDYLKRGLSLEGFSVQVAASGEAALAVLREQHQDLVILDWMLPGIDGLEVLKRLRSVDEHLPVIFLTAKDTARDQIESLELGADDFITKPVRFEVLLARIRVRLRSRNATQTSVLRFADIEMFPDAHRVTRGKRAISLTALEFKLLQTFLEHPERVMSKPTLLDRVWGTDFFGDQNVVEVYVKQLRQKLEAEGEKRLIQTIYGVGYVLREEGDDET